MILCDDMEQNETSNKSSKENSSYDYFTDWKNYSPWYVGLYRWGVFIIFKVIASLFYRQLKFKKKTSELMESGDYYDNNDVTVVLAVYNPPARFPDTIKSILANKPKDFIVVTTIGSKGCENVQEICSRFPEVTLLWEENLGKRDKLVKGIQNTKTKLVVLVDDDISWSPKFLEKLVAPFQHYKKIGGVGCKQVARVNGFCDIWGIMADMRLAVRFLELMATTRWDKGAACLSGRTACYRTEILQKQEFYDYILKEKFFGKVLLSGDDKCITRFVINQGFVTYHQLRENCKLETSFETGLAFFEQLKRWSRNTWRSDITALFVERKIWSVTPITAFILLDKMLTPFFMIYGITYLPYRLIIAKRYELLIGWIIWLIFSRFLKLIYYFRRKPQNIIFLPFFVIFQYVQALIRIWALITINERKWGTKDMTVKGNNIVNNKDVLKSKNYIAENDGTKSKKKKIKKNKPKKNKRDKLKKNKKDKSKDIIIKDSKKKIGQSIEKESKEEIVESIEKESKEEIIESVEKESKKEEIDESKKKESDMIISKLKETYKKNPNKTIKKKKGLIIQKSKLNVLVTNEPDKLKEIISKIGSKTELKDEPKNESKDELTDEVKDESIDEKKQFELKDEEKEEKEFELKDEPKENELKDEPKENELKDEPKDEEKEFKNEPKHEPKENELKDEPKENELKDEPKDEEKEFKNEPKDEPKEIELKDEPKENELKREPKDEEKDEHKNN